MEHKFETTKTFDGPAGNNYAELTIAREREREDAIKRGLIDDPNKPKALEDAQVFRGTCMDMCPLYEREQREYQNDVKRWEMNQTTGRIDKDLAVKAFHRPAAGNEQALPSDVRPPSVLTKTLNYLVEKIVSGSDPLDKDTHGFVRDRTRSIRQDFTLQNERGSEAVSCHERIVRFHILSLHQMCEIDGFDAHQEMEQLRKTLQSLAEYYDDQRENGTEFASEPEFRAYHVLTRLRDPDVLRHVQSLPQHVRRDPVMRHALNLYKYAQRSNEEVGRFKPPNCEGSHNMYSTFFRLIRSKRTSYTVACLCETQFNDVRKGALKSMRKALIAAVKAPSVDELIQILGCDDFQEVETLCEQYGVVVHADEGGIFRPVLNKSTVFDESRPDLRQRFSEKLVEAKRGNLTFANVINGTNPSSSSPHAIVESPSSRKRRLDSNKPSLNDSIFAAPSTTKIPETLSFNFSSNSKPPTTMFNFGPNPTKTNPPGPAKIEAHLPTDPPITSTTLQDPSPAKASVDRNKIVDVVVRDTVNKLLQDEVRSKAKQVLIEQAEKERATDTLLGDLAEQLVNDLLRNQLHDTILEVYTRQWHDKRLLRWSLRRLRKVSHQIQVRKGLERAREEAEALKRKQYNDAFTELSALTPRPHARKRARTSWTFPIATTQSLLQMKHARNEFWHPLDLDAMFEKTLLAQGQKEWRLVIALAELSCKSWFETKFGLINETCTRDASGTTFVVDMLPELSDARHYSDVGAVIFQCSDRPEADRELLLSLLQKVANATDHCFPLMIVCFYKILDEAVLAESLQIPAVLADKKSPVSACHFISIEIMSDAAGFQQTLEEMLTQKVPRPSPLGLERAAAKDQASRLLSMASRMDKSASSRRVPHIRPRNSFHDYAMLKPLPIKNLPIAVSQPIPSKQVSSLRTMIELANQKLARNRE